jgi:cyclase
MTTQNNDGISRREVILAGAGLLGIASTMSGREIAAAAQGFPEAVPPATDPHYPMPPSWRTELRELAPKVYAYVQGGGPNASNFGVSNAGMIAGPDSLTAIDALQGPIPAEAFIAAAKKATGKDFGRVINTHHHGDHVNGNQFFTQAEILGHPYCREECLKLVAGTPKTWASQPGVAEGNEERKLVPPMATFEDNLTYYIGDTIVQLKYAGPSHTWGDIVAYLPQHKILFAGDIAFFWVAPFAQNGYVSKWIEECDKILGWDVDVIVPGHGPIGGKKELAEMADYFRTLTVEARKRYDAKMSAGAAAADIRLGRFDNWIGPERIIMDTVRLYDEWNGSLIPDVDVGGIRDATAEYNEIKKKRA